MSDASRRSGVVTIVSSYLAPHVGGVETMVLEHARGLQELGWDVEVVTTRLRGDPPAQVIRGVPIRRHRAPNPFERRFDVPIPLVPPTLMRSIVRADRRPDVVVAHGHVYISSMWAAVATRRHAVPLVVVQSNPFVEYSRPVEWIERAADSTVGRRVLERASVVACISEYTQEYVTRIAPSARSTVVPCGVDTSRFNVDGSQARPARVVTVRRLVDRNGVDVLIDAWRRAALDDRAELLIGGTGPESERLAVQARGLPNVHLIGFVPDEGLADLYRSARVAVMPTRSGEGFGLMAAEAMACGTPVVATRQGALPEIVRHGVNGMLVPVDDPGAMASAIVDVITDDALHDRLAAGARATDLSWAASCARLDAVLAGVVASAG